MRTLSLLRRPSRAARTLHPRIPHRPSAASVVPTFAIRIGHPAALPFLAELAPLDAAIRGCLDSVAGQIRPVATVLLPEALHVVACGSAEAVRRLAEALGAILESAEVEAILESGLREGRTVLDPLRISVIRVSSLVGAAGTVLDLPQARGLVSSAAWPFRHVGEA
jgi:hypothetical protein